VTLFGFFDVGTTVFELGLTMRHGVVRPYPKADTHREPPHGTGFGWPWGDRAGGAALGVRCGVLVGRRCVCCLDLQALNKTSRNWEQWEAGPRPREAHGEGFHIWGGNLRPAEATADGFAESLSGLDRRFFERTFCRPLTLVFEGVAPREHGRRQQPNPAQKLVGKKKAWGNATSKPRTKTSRNGRFGSPIQAPLGRALGGVFFSEAVIH